MLSLHTFCLKRKINIGMRSKFLNSVHKIADEAGAQCIIREDEHALYTIYTINFWSTERGIEKIKKWSEGV